MDEIRYQTKDFTGSKTRAKMSHHMIWYWWKIGWTVFF